MNYKDFMKQLGFQPKEGVSGVFRKEYTTCENYSLEIDFEKKKFNYGNLISAESKTTQNFSQTENWVVLECVNRLLEKGYPPQNITLEKTWATGHGTSGRLDIFVSKDETAYLMIECKTWGKEFDKEFTKLQKDGGQLFTYFQQDKSAEVIMLYASKFENNSFTYKNEIIKIEEDYRETANVKDFYDRWNKMPKQNGIFENWAKPYQYQSKALTSEDLKDIEQEDSSFIFNRFLEILRHNVVSDKPNAFNKIFTLFLCKIYDEKYIDKGEELAFQWFYGPFEYDGIKYEKDDHISFQKRLTDLYKKGMNAFLDKEVTDFSDAEFNNKYAGLEDSVKESLRNAFTEIRLKKNNEFAIKEVFNDDSFEENAKVVKEVIELLQPFKIRYTKKQQYLSDFFELLLTTGLKQESGQFFTPVPIAQFIIKSLPIDKLVLDKLKKGRPEEGNVLPTVIDYASGSGHFVTESMHEIQSIINKLNPNDYSGGKDKKIKNWQNDHFDWALEYVYGIEKDYRLVKVGKVGCYLHGDGLAQIVHSDGLGNFTKTKEYKKKLTISNKDFPQDNNQFDIVVSNPPYSVNSFRNNARKYYTEKDFKLYNKLTDNSSEIECLFVERTKQLLKEGGVAGVILPESILNNDSEVNTKTRELIFNYFEIIGITEFGSNVFMATNIKTKVLFMRRRNNYFAENLRKKIEKNFIDFADNTTNGIEKPLSKYIAYVWDNITMNDYRSLLKKHPNKKIRNHEIFQEYQDRLTTKKKQIEWDKILDIEQEKYFYFILNYSHKIVLINTGKKAEEKQFIGYEFSERKRKEGIHPIKGNSIEACTKLFDSENYKNPERASSYIYNAFAGKYTKINESLKSNVEYVQLLDLIDFKSALFDLKIQKTQKINIDYSKIWVSENLQYLFEVTEIQKGKSITKAKTITGEIPVIAGGKSAAYYHNQSNREGNIITVSASGAYAGFINYFEKPIFASDCNTIKSKNEENIPTKLLFYILKVIQNEFYLLQRGQAQPHVYGNDIEKIKIPILNNSLSGVILAEIEQLEIKSKTVVINDIEKQIANIIKKHV